MSEGLDSFTSVDGVGSVRSIRFSVTVTSGNGRVDSSSRGNAEGAQSSLECHPTSGFLSR